MLMDPEGRLVSEGRDERPAHERHDGQGGDDQNGAEQGRHLPAAPDDGEEPESREPGQKQENDREHVRGFCFRLA